MTITCALVLLPAFCLSLNAWCQAPPKSAPALSQPAPGAYADVEGGMRMSPTYMRTLAPSKQV